MAGTSSRIAAKRPSRCGTAARWASPAAMISFQLGLGLGLGIGIGSYGLLQGIPLQGELFDLGDRRPELRLHGLQSGLGLGLGLRLRVLQLVALPLELVGLQLPGSCLAGWVARGEPLGAAKLVLPPLPRFELHIGHVEPHL
jgi:hypothetical protein